MEQQILKLNAKLKTHTMTMLVGLPGSGKTTAIRNHLAKMTETSQHPTKVISTDMLIEMYAMDKMKTYDQVFNDYIKIATVQSLLDVEQAVKDGSNIIWDQTNLTIKGRKSKLEKIPDWYHKEALVIICAHDPEWWRRLGNRPGKTIPKQVLATMQKSYQEPSCEEGFDHVAIMFT